MIYDFQAGFSLIKAPTHITAVVRPPPPAWRAPLPANAIASEHALPDKPPPTAAVGSASHLRC